MTNCLHCGKPLGSGRLLCYGCASEGISPEEVVDPDADVVERVERYFVVASVKCANCNELHGTVTVDGEEYTAADFGIESLEEWRLELDKEEAWMRDHREAVEAALPSLADEWPQSVAALRSTVL
jgi:hypothetical protein